MMRASYERTSVPGRIDDRVRKWARANVPDVYNYSAPASWYRAAVSAGVITRAESDMMMTYYGDTWNYAGD
jgi:hypothetical protein